MNTDYLNGWDVESEQRKADFIEYLYQKSGRTNGLFTGLWNQFCLESGEQARKDMSTSLK